MALRDRLKKAEGVAVSAVIAVMDRPDTRQPQEPQQPQQVQSPQPGGFGTSTRARATPDQATKIRAELERIMGADHRDFPEALALALADPDAALSALPRTTSQNVPEAIADDLVTGEVQCG
jgi:hypothetical protein